MTAATRFLVTGAGGFIGLNLVAQLSQLGAVIYCAVFPGRQLDIRLRSLAGVSPVGFTHSGASPFLPISKVNPEIVINLAAPGVSASERKDGSTVLNNVDIVLKTLEAVADTPPRLFIHVGSWSEYRGRDDPKPLVEDDPIEPQSMYGVGKAAAAFAGSAFARALGLPFVVLRLFNVYGVGEGSQRLLPSLIRGLTRSMPVSLTDGLQVRDFTYVDDVVSALLLASNCDLEAYSAYNVCSGHPISVRTVAETTARILDRPSDLLKFGSLPTRLDEPAFVVGDPSRFNSATGWTPTVSLDEGIRRMINLYRLQVGTYSEQ